MAVDRKARIVLLNGMTEKLFGYRRPELLGQPIEVLIPEMSKIMVVMRIGGRLRDLIGRNSQTQWRGIFKRKMHGVEKYFD
jgi:PAS domain S-box-containing protein